MLWAARAVPGTESLPFKPRPRVVPSLPKATLSHSLSAPQGENMTKSRGRRPYRAFTALMILFAVTALVATGWERPAAGSGPRTGNATLDRLKLGLGCWESGGRYDLRNPVSGAYGKYQIMPANWTSWAKRYLGRGRAKPNAANQERVASAKLQALAAWLKRWDRVLYWWLTGATGRDRTRWSDTATRYVEGILSMADRAATAAGRRSIPKRCFSSPPDAGPVGGTGHGGKGGSPHRATHRRVIVSALYVRAHAGIDQAPLGFLGYGDVVTVLDRAKDGDGRTWIHIARDGSPDGWAARWFTVLLN